MSTISLIAGHSSEIRPIAVRPEPGMFMSSSMMSGRNFCANSIACFGRCAFPDDLDVPLVKQRANDPFAQHGVIVNHRDTDRVRHGPASLRNSAEAAPSDWCQSRPST